MGLYKKIHEVMKNVKYIQKDDTVGEGNSKYKALSEEKVTEIVRAELIKQGLIIIPIEQTHTRIDSSAMIEDKYKNIKEKWTRLTTVDVKYKIIDVESGEFEILASSGTGVDSQDKGVGKAMTYAYKYMLLRTFAIPTGEDPDQIASDEFDKDIKSKKDTKPEPPKNNKPEQPKQDIKPSEMSQNPTKTPLEQRVTTIYMRCKNGLKWTDANFKAWLKDAKEAGFIKSESSKTMSESDVIYIETEYLKLKKAKETAA